MRLKLKADETLARFAIIRYYADRVSRGWNKRIKLACYYSSVHNKLVSGCEPRFITTDREAHTSLVDSLQPRGRYKWYAVKKKVLLGEAGSCHQP